MAAKKQATCAFCEIVRGERPAAIVYDDADCLGFLDIRPLLPGHTLVVPKTHVETLDDLPADLVAPLFEAAQRLSKAVQQALDADGSFVAANVRVSQSIPHVHVHVVPRNKGDGLFARSFVWKRQPYENQSAIDEMTKRIRAAVETIG